MHKLSFLIFLLCFANSVYSQKIYGTIYNNVGDLLPYSTITIKGTSIGTIANANAKFSLAVQPGTYTIICQRIGHDAIEEKISVSSYGIEHDFILKQQKLLLDDIVVKASGDNKAYRIIKNAIGKRNFYLKQVSAYNCDLYSKDFIKLKSFPKRILGKKIPEADRKEMGVDSNGKGIIYLSESIAKISVQMPKNFKMEVSDNRVSGRGDPGFSFPAFISFYNNNVNVFSRQFNPRGFISPIADGALSYYKYKYLGSFTENNKLIYSIKVIPRRNYEPLFFGIINIIDEDWRIHSTELTLAKSSQLEILDSLKISQLFVPINSEVWRIKSQVLSFNYSQFGIDAMGNFVNVYSNYNLNPKFGKLFFGPVIIKIDTGVNQRSKISWDTIRPIPLEQEELADFNVKDSAYQSILKTKDSKQYLDSLRKQQGKLNPLNIFIGGVNRTTYKKSNNFKFGLKPLLQDLEYNFAEGLAITVRPFFTKFIKGLKSDVTIAPTFRYGLANAHFNAWLDINSNLNDEFIFSKNISWHISGGKRVSNFNNESTKSRLLQSLDALSSGNNFYKFYENYFAKIAAARQYESGLKLGITFLFEDRQPVNNSTYFVLKEKYKSNIKPNYPIEILNNQFSRHQALIFSIDISQKLGQRFIQFPKYKLSINNDAPIIKLNYTKGIQNIFGSDISFDKIKFGVSGNKNFKLYGLLKYNANLRGFIGKKNLSAQDYFHVNSNFSLRDFAFSQNDMNIFQLPGHYFYSNTSSIFATANLEQHLNGLLTNKIPLFKKLKWNLVFGTNVLAMKNANYLEGFVGLENILKTFRLDFVSGYHNRKFLSSGFRLRLDGIIGSSIKLKN